MKKPEEVMEILEAYDLSGSLRGAALLAGCDHKTVAHWVRQRELGLVPKVERKRPAMEMDFMRKVDELVARSQREDPGGRRAREARQPWLSRIAADDATVGC